MENKKPGIEMDTMEKAIAEGKKEFAEMKNYSEETYIKFAVARFIWRQFQDKPLHDALAVMEALQKVTK